MEHRDRPASFLASVRSESEARLCASLGADIIDAKDPATGALGALADADVRAIRASVPAHIPVSATIGDLPADPDLVADAVLAKAATGVEVVKIGLSPGKGATETLERLGGLSLGGARLVGVLLADKGVDLGLIPRMAAEGFAGVMLDTSDKRSGALPDVCSVSTLRAFIEAARCNGLFAGLAGSLRAEHVPGLLVLGPDLMGFRGGLCREGDRTGALDGDAVSTVRRAIPLGKVTALEACRAAPGNGMAPTQPEQAL